MREKELRLALVCYGGISLAVYMHGITKEVWRLARASRAFQRRPRGGGGGVEGVYAHLLMAIAARRTPTCASSSTSLPAPARAGSTPSSSPCDQPPARRSIRSPTSGSIRPTSMP
jgi:hypothetical protein